MSAAVAASLVLVLFLATAAMVLVAYRMDFLRLPLGAAGGLLVLALAFNATGGLSPADASIFPVPARGLVSGDADGPCGQAWEVLEQNGVILDRRGETQIVVDRRLWAQIPGPTRQLLADCLQTSDDPATEVVEIIER
jgi:hypothetical protein